MTQTDPPPRHCGSLSPAGRLVWLLLIAATLYFSYFHNLGVIGLVGPDEPRYAWIAREMAETGDWVTPRLYGKPWFEKPPLYYWGAALGFKWFGVSEATARMPSAFSALFATLAMGWLAWRLYGSETALWLLLLLPTTVGMIGFSHAAATDMPFAGMLTVAMVCASVALGVVPDAHGGSRPRYAALLFFGVFLGGAVLAKGPAGLILSGGAVLFWAIFTKRWREAWRCFHPVAITGFCVTALPWYILCARRNPDFLRVFIVEHNIKRYFTPEFQHLQPFWFYAPVVFIAFLPWTVVLLWGVVRGIRRIRQHGGPSSPTLLLLCFVVLCLVFFSASKSKLPGYMLPAFPAIGVLLARCYVIFAAPYEKSLRSLVSGFATLALLVGVGLMGFANSFATSRSAALEMMVTGCVLLAFALANQMLTLRSGTIPVAAFCVVPLFFLILFFRVLSHPWMLWDPSGRTLAAELSAARLPPEHVYPVDMKRGQLYSLSFYVHRQIEPWSSDQTSTGYLLAKSRRCPDLVNPLLVCAHDAIELGRSGWFAYRVENRGNSMSGLDGLGGLGRRSNGNAGNGHAR